MSDDEYNAQLKNAGEIRSCHDEDDGIVFTVDTDVGEDEADEETE